MVQKANNAAVYQVRTLPGTGPQAVMDQLTNALWKSLESDAVPGRLDPHRWREVHGLILRVLRRRLARYSDCGYLEACQPSPERVYWPDGGPPGERTHIYLLELRRDPDRLLSAITRLVRRRYRRQSTLPRSAWYGLELRARTRLRKVLGDYLFYSPRCSGCLARQGAQERRFWSARW